MNNTNESGFLMEGNHSEALSAEEIELLEQLFRENLPKSPIDLNYYESLASTNESIRTTLDEVLSSSLVYTEDIANLEKTILKNPGDFDEDRERLDQVRTRAHNAVIDNINIFARTLRANKVEVNWFTWSTDNRVAYKKFAVALTLNRFKDSIIKYRKEIVSEINEKIKRHEINIGDLKMNANEAQLVVINYVEILINVNRNSENKDEKQRLGEVDMNSNEMLTDIERRLMKSKDEILSAFYRISLKR